MILKRQGYFKEMQCGEDTDPSIFDFIHKSKLNKDKIVKYLQSGIVLAACGSVVEDIINPQNGIIGTPDDLTDGTWMWPADLSYYVERYDLKLDEEFLDHMSKNSWKVPTDVVIDENDLEVL